MAGAHPEGFNRRGLSEEAWAEHPMSQRYPGRHTALRWAELYRQTAVVKLLRKFAESSAEAAGDEGEAAASQQPAAAAEAEAPAQGEEGGAE